MARSEKDGDTRSQDEIKLRPVGFIRSSIAGPSLVASADGLEQRSRYTERLGQTSEIIIDSELEGILDGIEGFSHLLVLYWAHCVPPEGRKLLKGHPMGRKEMPLTGIFATCSPARPNPILVTGVRLIEHKGNVLVVEGLDAVDGSPVVDIKPYVSGYYLFENTMRPEWMIQIEREFADGAGKDDEGN
jgi:tRNA-Thr(GGU) m(6)t(6)A37 methyltransferase TsaA